MTNIATLSVAMVGSVITVSWLTWRLVRGVPEGCDSETEVKTPLVTIRRKVHAQRAMPPNADAVQKRYSKIKDASSDADRPGSDDN
jgi:hypothetical protein